MKDIVGDNATKETLLKGEVSTDDLHVLTNSDQIYRIFFLLFNKSSYLNEEVNRIGPSTSVRVPC